jgi:hypothetical protein
LVRSLSLTEKLTDWNEFAMNQRNLIQSGSVDILVREAHPGS